MDDSGVSNNSQGNGDLENQGPASDAPPIPSQDIRLADAAYTEVKVLMPKRLGVEQQAVEDLLDLAENRRHIPIVLDMQETEPLQITRWGWTATGDTRLQAGVFLPVMHSCALVGSPMLHLCSSICG